MYPVSDLAKQIIQSDDRNFEWIGTITLSDGTVHSFDMSNIVQSTGSLRTSCNAPWIGQTVSTEMSMQLYIDIDSEKLKNAVIGLSCKVLSLIDIETWEDLLPYTWNDVTGLTWGEEDKILSTNIPIGVFTVQKARRSVDTIQFTAYDNMSKFDVEVSTIDSAARNGYQWLQLICNRCGVPLDMTSSQIRRLPNGNRSIVFSDPDSSVKTYRDMISSLAYAYCSVAVMSRTGGLLFVPCKSKPVFTYTPDNRFSSEFEDYKTSYTGVYAQYKASGVQEYYTNADDAESDDGSIIDLGTNPFLQISSNNIRKSAIQSIINGFKDYQITPFVVEAPYDPTIDLMDVVEFAGRHAPENALAPITDFTRTINGSMSIQCDASETAEGLLREDKTIEGISGSSDASGTSYASSGFWVEIASFPDSTKQISDDTVTTSKDIEFTIEKTKTQIAWTGTYSLSSNATTTAKVYIGDEIIYQVADEQDSGNHLLSLVTGYEVAEKGNKNIRVVLSVSSGSLTINANCARMTILGLGYGDISIDSGESLSLEEQLLEDLFESLEIDDPDFDPEEFLKEWEEEWKEEWGDDEDDSPWDDEDDSSWDEEDEEEKENNPHIPPEEVVKKGTDTETGEEKTYEYNKNTGDWEDKDGEKAPKYSTTSFGGNSFHKYKERLDGKYGDTGVPDFDSTNVNGNNYYDPTKPLDKAETPYRIVITTKPTKLTYASGETISLTGAVVTAQTVTGSTWTSDIYTDGTVPLNEIIISPTVAE